MTYRKSEDFAEETSPFRRFVRGMVRHVAITLTDAAKWQVVGQRGGQGGDETLNIEAFGGIGFYARPPSSGGNPEAIAVAVGGNKAMALVALRDEATRKAIANLAPDETAVFTSKAIIVIKADGTVEIRTAGGTAGPLVTQAQFLNHTHATAPNGPITPPTAIAVSPALTGTTVLKAE